MLGLFALALLALVATVALARFGRRGRRVAALTARDHPQAAMVHTLSAVAPVAAALLAERFETRRRSSGQRLTALAAALDDADPAMARVLLAEAEGIAHVLAGTAGMFGEVQLGKVARQVEAEIKARVRADTEGDPNPVLVRLIAALDAPVPRPDSRERLRA